MMRARLNLLFIVNALDVGGAERHTVTLINALDPERFRNTLVCLKPADALRAQIDSRRVEGGIHDVRVTRKLDIGAVRRIAASIDAQSIDVIVCVNTYPLLYGTLARLLNRLHAVGDRNIRIPLVEIFHTTDPGNGEQPRMALYRQLFAATDMVVYVSRLQYEYWSRRGWHAHADSVIRNGVNVDHFRVPDAPQVEAARAEFGVSPGEYLIGLCAAMRPEKRHEDLVAAIAALRLQGLPARGLLIGDGPCRALIEARIAQSGMAPFIHITGMRDDVRPCIAACDVMTLVSHHVETFSLAALESMAMGKPVVMSEIGGAAEQVRHGINGYLYPRGDIEALTLALELLSDPGMRARMGRTAAQMVRRAFSLDGMVTEYEQLFTQIAGQPGAQRVAHAG